VQSPKTKKPKSKHSKLPEPKVTRAEGLSILFRRTGSGSAAAATTAEAKVNAHSSDDAAVIVSQGATTEKLSKGGRGASPSDQQKPGDSVKNLEPSSTSSAAPLGAEQQEDEKAADEETHKLPLLPAGMTWDESSEGLALHVAAEGEFDINDLAPDYPWFPSSFTLVQSSPWSGDVICEDICTRDAAGNFIQSDVNTEKWDDNGLDDEELGDEELGDEEKAELEQQRLWDRWSIECAKKKINEAIDLVGEYFGDEEEAGDSGEEVIDMGSTPASDRVQLAEGLKADIHFYDAMGRLQSRTEKMDRFRA
jgi:hypothetical protein